MGVNHKMRPQNEGRNHAIWQANVNGLSQAQIAEQFGLSVSTIQVILKQVVNSIPEEERSHTAKLRRAYLDKVRRRALAIADLPPKKRYAPNGRELDGEDYSEVLAALDRVLKADERIARLTGTDNAIQHSVSVSAEAQQATREAADKAAQNFPEVFGVVPAGSG